VGPAGVNGVPLGAPLVNYPAASPYVIGVGGTSLLTNTDGTYYSELTWATGGGGLSQFEGAPNWQGSAVSLLGTANLRGVPDIAMDADPNSGAIVYVNGVAEEVGGTSLSSPLSLGVWARAMSANHKIGNAGPTLYSLYDGTTTPATYPKGGFHDITLGTNTLYTALPGYDLTTGLGTFIVDQVVAGLKPTK
jgi:pseudomonalisin